MYTDQGKPQILESLTSYEKKNFIKLISLNKKKPQKEKNRKTFDLDYTSKNKVVVKGREIKEKYAAQYLELKKVLSSYVNDDDKTDFLVPVDTKAFVVVSGGTRRRPRIVTSYPRYVFHMFNSNTKFSKRYRHYQIERFRIKNVYLRNCLSYWPWWLEDKLEHNPYEQPFRRFPKGYKIKAVHLQNNYEMLTDRGFSDRRTPSKDNEKTSQFGLAFTFLSKMDAKLFLKQTQLENSAIFVEDKWWARSDAVRHKNDICSYSSVKDITLNNFYHLLKKSQNKNKGRKVKKVGVVVPKFLYYAPVNTKLKRRVKRVKKNRLKKVFKNIFFIKSKPVEPVSIKHKRFTRDRKSKKYYYTKRTFIWKTPKGLRDFPKEMLSKSGFQGVPVYKTKPIEKNQFLSIPKRYKKYFTGKTLFITLDKNQYRKSARQDNKKITFYKPFKEEEKYVDTLKNAIEERKELHNEVLENLLENIDKKRWRGIDLNSTLNFVKENYNEPHLLEKTNYYIKKVKRRNIFKL